MLTKEEILYTIKRRNFKSKCIDSRDFGRLSMFFEKEDLKILGFEQKEGAEHIAIPFTEENILKQLSGDVAFGFEKALNKRGISSSLMYYVVKMWLWVLEDKLRKNRDYAQYGLPLFKSVAIKYGFPNPIGDDSGNEDKYSSDWDE